MHPEGCVRCAPRKGFAMSFPHPPLHAGDAPSEPEIEALYAAFCARTLPKPHWTHAAHIVAAARLIREEGLASARTRMPELIRGYNLSNGVMNTNTSGYHETLTQFFLGEIDAFLETRTEAALDAVIAALLASPIARQDYPMRFYEPETLLSPIARRRWIRPDLPYSVVAIARQEFT